MKKKKEVTGNNYLEKIPVRPKEMDWSVDEAGMVTLNIENRGFFNRVAQRFFKKPKVSYIHLDEIGSYVWPLLDGKRDIITLGSMVKEHFGQKSEPLYERLAKFFQILDSYGFLNWK